MRTSRRTPHHPCSSSTPTARSSRPGAARVTATTGRRTSTASKSMATATCGWRPSTSGGELATGGASVYPDTNEVFVADGYGNRRVVVLDAVRGQKLGRRVVMQVAGIVTPDTILRWYRRVIAQTYDGSARRGRGRPMPRRDVAARVVRHGGRASPVGEDTRIRGALSNLGHEIARTTVKRTRHDHGIDPAPERSRRMPGKTVLQAPWEGRHGLRSVHRRGAHAGRAPAVPGLLRDRAARPAA